MMTSPSICLLTSSSALSLRQQHQLLLLMPPSQGEKHLWSTMRSNKKVPDDKPSNDGLYLQAVQTDVLQNNLKHQFDCPSYKASNRLNQSTTWHEKKTTRRGFAIFYHFLLSTVLDCRKPMLYPLCPTHSELQTSQPKSFDRSSSPVFQKKLDRGIKLLADASAISITTDTWTSVKIIMIYLLQLTLLVETLNLILSVLPFVIFQAATHLFRASKRRFTTFIFRNLKVFRNQYIADEHCCTSL